MKRRKLVNRLAWTIISVALLWTAVTIWVEMEGPARWTRLGEAGDSLKVLIVYDPDPIYNLDEQICNEIARGIGFEDAEVIIATAAATHDDMLGNFNAVVVCANTYNWAPDWAVTRFIKSHPQLKDIPVVAVTVGSGSTSASHHRLNKLLGSRNIDVIDEREWWLMRPNDESRIDEENVKIAKDQAYKFGRQVGTRIKLRR